MNKKNAFTMSELLIIMGIIGVIATFGIATLQRYDKGIRFRYSNVYHSLDRALYNSANFKNLPNPFVETETDEEGTTVEVTAVEGAKRLCAMLTEYINSFNTNCSNENVASDDGATFGTPFFTSSSGVDFYITQRLPETISQGDHPFFIVYANLNRGKRGAPNMDYEPATGNGNLGKDPDIFAFAALDIGRMCPLGPPEIDPKYMQTRIAYQDILSQSNSGDEKDEIATKYSKVSKPYFVSKAEAWGFYLSGDDGFDAVDQNGNAFYIDDNPYSYNDYIRTKIDPESKIYSFMADKTYSDIMPSDIHLMKQPIARKNATTNKYTCTVDGAVKTGSACGYNCVKKSDEECELIIDKYLY